MSRLKTELKSSQMPYPVSIGFQFLFRKLGYRFVKLTEYCGFVIRQCSCYWYSIGTMMTEQIDRDIQSVDKRPHLNQPLNLRLFDVCAVQHLLIQSGFGENSQRDDVDDTGMQFVQHLGSGYRACLAVAFTTKSFLPHVEALITWGDARTSIP